MGELREIRLTVNGMAREGRAEARKLLVDFLRENLGLTGTHVGCEHGVCGACTILLNGEAARSCLMLAVQADGAEILTVEGLATDGKLHPLQQAVWEHHGLQCGFCTPGMLLTAYDLLRVNPSDWSKELEDTSDFFEKFGKRLPEELREEHRRLAQRFDGLAVAQK